MFTTFGLFLCPYTLYNKGSVTEGWSTQPPVTPSEPYSLGHPSSSLGPKTTEKIVIRPPLSSFHSRVVEREDVQ